MELQTSLILSGLTVVIFGTFIYQYLTKYFDYFKLQGIPYVKPVLVFGSWWNIWNKSNFHHIELERCKKYGKVFGMLQGRLPSVVVSDPELLRKIFVKDFEHFSNRVQFAVDNEFLAKSLARLNDGEWKEMRSILSPLFTTGKIKQMINLMNEPAETLVKHLQQHPQNTKIDIRTNMSSFVMDVITTCGFGIKIDSLGKPNDPFVRNAMDTFSPATEANVTFVLSILYPSLAKYLMPADAYKGITFFADIARQILRERKGQDESLPKRHDFVDMIIEASKPNGILQDETMIVSQLIIFLIAGFDTTAFTISVTLHLLAQNPEAQGKVRDEIVAVIKKNNGEVDYDVIRQLPYLDQCIYESMRLYPVSARLDRKCTKDIEYDEFKLKKGMSIVVPIYAIHRDAEYYPNPDEFDPERFSTEGKSTRDPIVYLPFGYGNRNCIGMRFAMDNMKFGLCYLLANFKFLPVVGHNSEPKMTCGMIGFLQGREFWLKLEHLPSPIKAKLSEE